MSERKRVVLEFWDDAEYQAWWDALCTYGFKEVADVKVCGAGMCGTHTMLRAPIKWEEKK